MMYINDFQSEIAALFRCNTITISMSSLSYLNLYIASFVPILDLYPPPFVVQVNTYIL